MESLISFSDGLFSGDFLESKIFYTILAIVVFWLIRRISLIVLLRGRDVQVQYRIRKSVAYITYPLAFLVIGRIWFAGIQAVSTYLGLLSAGLAIALQTPLVNLAGWAFILWRQPFKVGDRVQLGDHRGDVIDQRFSMKFWPITARGSSTSGMKYRFWSLLKVTGARQSRSLVR
jgi:small-conductance mechanosensitive channel